MLFQRQEYRNNAKCHFSIVVKLWLSTLTTCSPDVQKTYELAGMYFLPRKDSTKKHVIAIKSCSKRPNFWPRISTDWGKIAWTGSLGWPLFASLLFLEVDLQMVSEEMKPLVRVASCLVTPSSHQLPCYCVPGCKDCCYIRMIFFHCSIAHCWLTGLILLGQRVVTASWLLRLSNMTRGSLIK